MYEMCRKWVAEGTRVTIVTAPYEKSDIRASRFIDRQTIEGIDVIVIRAADSNRDSVLKRAVNALIFALVSCYYSLTLKYDVVMASSGPITVGIPALLAKWFRGKRMVFEVRDLWPQGAIELQIIRNKLVKTLALFFEKLCYRNSSLVAACSEGMEEGVKARVSDVETIVIPNACDVELFHNPGITAPELPNELQGKKIFLYTGSLGLMDDCIQIIQGMRVLSDPDIALIFIGDGAERRALEKAAKESGNPNILFLGLKPKTEVVKWYSIATASFVTFKDFPVLHTSSPNKMFDSFAAGVPIIQSTKGWIKRLVEREQCGINVRPDQPSDFAAAMKRLAEDTEFRTLLSNNAFRLANTLFNRKLLAEKYLLAIKDVLT